MAYVAADTDHLVSDLPVGSGECVALVEQATGAPHASSWRKGALVKGNTALAKGTAIATFNAQGKYGNHRHGNHAAIYLDQDANGLRVIDQWNIRDPKTHQIVTHVSPHIHTLRFGNRSYSDNGDNFSVVQ